MEKAHIIYLLQQYFSDKLSSEELSELSELLQNIESKQIVIESLTEIGIRLEKTDIDEERFEPILKKIISTDRSTEIKKSYIRTYFVAAACIILMFGAGLYFYLQHNKTTEISADIVEDIQAPQTDKAVITLSDGKSVSLDSVKKGMITQTGNLTITKLNNGQIVYNVKPIQQLKELQYNTLTNPRGSKTVNIILSDGSHIWLNAGSAITYPVLFAGNERKVELQGEAYFEIAKDKQRPFLVVNKSAVRSPWQVSVLGTHFNINAYEDEKEIKTTLLEGKVRMNAINREILLSPGQQSNLTGTELQKKTLSNADLERQTAWLQGVFRFEKTPADESMREISRWYDVNIIYKNGVPPDIKFSGELNRDLSLLQLLDALGKVGIKLRMDGRNLILL